MSGFEHVPSAEGLSHADLPVDTFRPFPVYNDMEPALSPVRSVVPAAFWRLVTGRNEGLASTIVPCGCIL